ncbi:fimbria/pilus chaperone family protein [Pseudomonas frederiksbergensis]|uniref:fimbria/pilus chaperone family protein n=1 Tax=Pseudomonas frederiksbergensis TaxID=104087 RepID=UPI000FF2B05A|nr:fimbria/pilus chaperone family protein [Pseudomonas frederiksbergensis]RON55411.1 fimbrial chaperone protein [Pseudomonas frederiksbergensis]
MPFFMSRAGFTTPLPLLFSLLVATQAYSAGMVPQTPVLVVEESLGEATMNVRNTDTRPALLHTTVENIEQDDEWLLVFTPPMARVEPGEVQQVRFILQNTQPLRTERLKRVIFEGISPVEGTSGARVNLGVRQNLPVILRPADLPVEREPWKRLKWSSVGGDLQVFNSSPYVVRLAKAIVPLPGVRSVDLPRTYILPGERLRLEGVPGAASSVTGVRIFPATTYGFAVEQYDAAVINE